ncbi:RNA 3'-terminal phosphate cyclase-like protein [Hypsibius exemplaris]|uniref:RNA 3'-terminal phosphate cyclase-like protein n=1 Tax=Hypsibius exemplaris TaxID=2072580 RepID=A0A9X6RNW9_HYPEX|nr:RNA 3'-terminal phosphate cyclase-like protein [Hypsibius exemplaris]
MEFVEFTGSAYFRQILSLATLSGKSVRISKIRQKDEHPGLSDHEISFLRLLEKVTNGTLIDIDETGTKVTYQPGLLSGGDVEHDCHPDRSITYYLEALLLLASFMKKPLNAVLRGVTNDNVDPSVDAVKHSTLPLLLKFLGTGEGLNLKVVKRGLRPNGGGEIHFSCPCRAKLRPLQMKDSGLIRSIRGIAFACKVSPATGNRIGESAKKILKEYVADVYCYTDLCKGPKGGLSPGFGITLIAETVNGVRYAVDVCSNPADSNEEASIPEDLGENAANLLLDEIYRGGSVSSSNQSLALLLMCLGHRDISKIQTGQLSPFTIQFVRYIKLFFGVEFRLSGDEVSEDAEKGKVTFTCVGIGYSNLNKTVS